MVFAEGWRRAQVHDIVDAQAVTETVLTDCRNALCKASLSQPQRRVDLVERMSRLRQCRMNASRSAVRGRIDPKGVVGASGRGNQPARS
jgi:hypothetical protein